MPKLFGKSLSRAELNTYCSDPSLLFGVDQFTFQDGPERGVRMLRFRTGGGLEFDVILDRAMDIASMRHGGVPVGWHGPAGFRHGAYHEPEGEDGLGWARSASGLVSTCGLDHIHAPVEDTADHYHYDLKDRVAHKLHGRISFAPARLRSYGVEWSGDEAVVFAEAEIRQAALFGEQLSLIRRIEADLGGQTIRQTDTVTNIGFDPAPHAILYHVNLGYPVLDEGSELWADIRSTPWTLRDGDPIIHGKPSAPYEQRVYEHDVAAGADGMVSVALANQSFVSPQHGSGLAFELSYDSNTLPAFFQWQYFQSGNYVTAIEPCSTHAGSRADWLAKGEMPMLAHGESRTYQLAMTCHVGEGALDDLKARLMPA
ncbi:MAG: aldose 1-epimerase family protein [Pseudomonadota bacterium]|nr:aldose 1-epimerase family protein [Pseudomonadota bacterium]